VVGTPNPYGARLDTSAGCEGMTMSDHRQWRTIVRKNTRTEVMSSSETRRKRTRSAVVQDAIRQFEDDIDDALDVFPDHHDEDTR